MVNLGAVAVALVLGVVAAVVCLLAAFVPLATLAEMVSIGTIFAFFVVAIAVVVLRRTKPQLKRPFRTPPVPWLPVASALSCLALMASLAVETWLRFLVWLALGPVVYFAYGRTHSRLAPGVSDGDADARARGRRGPLTAAGGGPTGPAYDRRRGVGATFALTRGEC